MCILIKQNVFTLMLFFTAFRKSFETLLVTWNCSNISSIRLSHFFLFLPWWWQQYRDYYNYLIPEKKRAKKTLLLQIKVINSICDICTFYILSLLSLHLFSLNMCTVNQKICLTKKYGKKEDVWTKRPLWVIDVIQTPECKHSQPMDATKNLKQTEELRKMW